MGMGNVEGCGGRGGGLKDDWRCGEGVINAGYNRVGIEGGERGKVGWAGGRGQRESWGEGDIFVARTERRWDLKDGIGLQGPLSR